MTCLLQPKACILLATMKKIPSLEIYRDKQAGKLYLSKKNLNDSICNCLNLWVLRLQLISLSATLSLQTEKDVELMSHVSYSTNARVCSWPDISRPWVLLGDIWEIHERLIGKLWKDPSYLRGIKKWVWYLRGTRDVSLIYDHGRGTSSCDVDNKIKNLW